MPNRKAAFAAPITLLFMLPQAASAQTVTSLQIAPLTVEVGVGESVSVLVTAYDNRGNVVPAAQFLWSSGAPNVARVDFSPATPNIATVVGISEGTTRLNVRVGTIQESSRTADLQMTHPTHYYSFLRSILHLRMLRRFRTRR